MREYAAPMTYQVPRLGNLTDDVVRNAAERGERVVFNRKSDAGWEDVTARDFLAEVGAVAKGLVAAGIEVGDRVALISRTRYEWTLLDYAIWFTGAVTVPVYETSSADQIGWILHDSGARAVVAETPEHLARIDEVRADLPDLVHVWSLDEGAVDTLGRLGSAVSDSTLEERRTHAVPDDLATLVYTSGTTGRPKGCMLTHGNFMVELEVALDELKVVFTDDSATLLFLPLAHVFARIIQVGCVKGAVRMGHSSDIPHLTDDLQAFRPTFVLAVPRVFEKLFNTASQKAAAEGRGRLFDRAADVAIAWSRGLDHGRSSLLVRVQHELFGRLLYRKLRAALGGACEYAISGGAPLGERLGHFYRGIGLTVLEGYGLTETTAAVTANRPDALKVGSVGRPMAGAAVRVADDGELLFRGGQVFSGYWRNEEATAEAMTPEGWFRTGDIGEVDDEGFVRITGRKKEIIVTAGGKNVAPAVLEDRLRAHALISQCMVVGDGRPFIGALVTIDPEVFGQWADSHEKTGTVAEMVDDPDLRSVVGTAIAEANRAVSQAESIRRFAILPEDWTEESGQLTPSLKLKRNVVMAEFKDDVASLYLP